MPNVNPIKGMHVLRTLGTTNKNAIPDKQSDFIKLYVLEKERTRLRNEETRILLRLETIKNRLKDIQEFYNEKIGQGISENPFEENQKDEEDKMEWKIVPISY